MRGFVCALSENTGRASEAYPGRHDSGAVPVRLASRGVVQNKLECIEIPAGPASSAECKDRGERGNKSTPKTASMNKLFGAFLRHMRQPMYKDRMSGDCMLPWIRFHSIKGYNDMLSILEGFPAIRQTLDRVPSLIVQIQKDIDGKATDVFYELSKKPAADLTADDDVKLHVRRTKERIEIER